jgi:hypothetical protein
MAGNSLYPKLHEISIISVYDWWTLECNVHRHFTIRNYRYNPGTAAAASIGRGYLKPPPLMLLIYYNVSEFVNIIMFDILAS